MRPKVMLITFRPPKMRAANLAHVGVSHSVSNRSGAWCPWPLVSLSLDSFPQTASDCPVAALALPNPVEASIEAVLSPATISLAEDQS